ncbi:MAG: transposase [Eubacterium sp.]|nr:transposase [Eubacterium sp.]
MFEFGAAKVDTGAPIFNYVVGFDTSNELPLLYEKYPGSINDVSQLQYMIDTVKSYGYRNIGFILDRGYFSKEKLNFMDQNGFAFVIMVKGLKDLVRDLALKNKGTFKSEWGSQVHEVPAAVRELEKIEICRQADHAYRLDHVVTKAQKEILDAFGINPADVKETARGIDKSLKREVLWHEQEDPRWKHWTKG